MTEAAHQVASNPLPPSAYNPGTVGPATGVEMAIIDAAANSLRRTLRARWRSAARA